MPRVAPDKLSSRTVESGATVWYCSKQPYGSLHFVSVPNIVLITKSEIITGNRVLSD